MSEEHHLYVDCDCHCPSCGAPLELVRGTVYAPCELCHGGEEPDGEDYRGGEAAGAQAEQQAAMRRLK